MTAESLSDGATMAPKGKRTGMTDYHFVWDDFRAGQPTIELTKRLDPKVGD